MSWYLDYKKYRKMVKQLVYHRTELEYQEVVLKEVHIEFNKYYAKYCAENDIDLSEFNKENSDNIEKEYEPLEKKQEVEEGIIVSNDKSKEDKEGMKEFSKVYKMIAKKIHPDVLAQRLQTEETLEKEEMFKIATKSYHECDWGVFVEIFLEESIHTVSCNITAGFIKKKDFLAMNLPNLFMEVFWFGRISFKGEGVVFNDKFFFCNKRRHRFNSVFRTFWKVSGASTVKDKSFFVIGCVKPRVFACRSG